MKREYRHIVYVLVCIHVFPIIAMAIGGWLKRYLTPNPFIVSYWFAFYLMGWFINLAFLFTIMTIDYLGDLWRWSQQGPNEEQ